MTDKYLAYNQEIVWVNNTRVHGRLELNSEDYSYRLIVIVSRGNVTRVFRKHYQYTLNAAYDWDLLFLELASYMTGERLAAFLASRS